MKNFLPTFDIVRNDCAWFAVTKGDGKRARMPYETRSRTGKKPDAVPIFEVPAEPAKSRSKKTDAEPKTAKKGSKSKGTSKSSKSSDSSVSNQGTLRGRPKDLPVVTEDEEEEVVQIEVNPMEKHRHHYGKILELFEAFMDGPEDEDLARTYDVSSNILNSF